MSSLNRILVTGGCGYIGSVLVPYLQDQEAVSEVVVLDSLISGSPRNLLDTDLTSAFTFHRGDVRNVEDVERAMADVDSVIHLAAITGAESTFEREEETYAINLDGTKNVLQAAEKLDVETVVFASSCNNYGRSAGNDIDETVEPEPINPYAETKHLAENQCAEFAADTGAQATALRMSTNYGHAPGIRFNLVVNHFVFSALTDRPLTVYGDGTNWRPFIHVRDAARAFADAALNPHAWPKPVYNVGANHENYQIADVATIVREELDVDPEITYLGEKNPGPSYHVNFDRLAQTGFDLQWTLRRGVRELAAAFGQESPDQPLAREANY